MLQFRSGQAISKSKKKMSPEIRIRSIMGGIHEAVNTGDYPDYIYSDPESLIKRGSSKAHLLN